MTELRQYQRDAVDAIRDASGNVLLVMPTGAGKTVVMGSIIKDQTHEVCAIAHRQELVGQISKALAREGIRHRLIASKETISYIVRDHTRRFGRSFHDPSAKVAVAGVDTLTRRTSQLRQWLPRVKLWLIDEAHHVLRGNKWGRAVELFPNATGLGVTATPCRTDGAGLGSHADGVFDTLINGPTMRQLINEGYLCDYRVFAPPTDFKIGEECIGSTGDFTRPKMVAATRDSNIIGDVVDHFVKIAGGAKGVIFNTDIESSEETARQLNARGVSAAAVSSKSTNMERDRAVRQLETGELQVLTNVDLFGEGFDLPSISVVSMARPTMSYGLFCQQFGRALRPEDGKQHAIIIDHVGNVARHGLPDRQRVWSLSRRERNSRVSHDPDMIPTRRCMNVECMGEYEAIHDNCPYCGERYEPADRSSPESVDGNLIELDAETLAAMRQEIQRIDEDADQLRHRMERAGAPGAAVGGAVKNHRLRQTAQGHLREMIATWAASQRTMGRQDTESYKRFFWRYGVDVLTAQALGRREAEELAIKIAGDMMGYGYTNNTMATQARRDN